MNQFFSRNFADLSKMRRRTSISSVRTFFFLKAFFTFADVVFTPQNILNRNSNYHFIYLPIQVNCKMMCLYYMYVEQLSFSDFVSNIINLTPVNIFTVFNKLEVPIHNSPSIEVLLVNPRQYSSVCINFSLCDTVSNFTLELKTLSQF